MNEPTGQLKAFTFVHLPRLNGQKRPTRISLGSMYCVSLETAKDMVHSLRKECDKQGVNVQAELKLYL